MVGLRGSGPPTPAQTEVCGYKDLDTDRTICQAGFAMLDLRDLLLIRIANPQTKVCHYRKLWGTRHPRAD